MGQRNKCGAQQACAALAVFAKQRVSGEGGKNQKAQPHAASNQNSFIFMLTAAQRQAKRAEWYDRPKQPDMESLSAQKGGTDGRKDPYYKRQRNAVKGADGRR